MDWSSLGKAMGGALIAMAVMGAAVAIALWELIWWLIRHVRISWIS